jgi:hypothetical protein
LPGLTLKYNPSNLCLWSSWDYRRGTPCPAILQLLISKALWASNCKETFPPWKDFKSILLHIKVYFWQWNKKKVITPFL